MELQYLKKKIFLTCFIYMFITSIFIPLHVNAATKILLHNTEIGGEIDNIYHRKDGVDHIIETDSYRDTEMDEYVFIPDGRLARIEQDTDSDSKIDVKQYYKDFQIIREEQFNNKGQLLVFIDYDDEGQPLKKRVDTNKDGHFDLVFNYICGAITGSIRDRDHDGDPDTWESYEDDMLIEQKVDSDGDGIIDYITRFDEDGHPFSMSLDNNKDGIMETYRSFIKGELLEEMEDQDLDGRYEKIL